METIQTATDRERATRFTDLYVRDHPRVSAFLYRRVGDRGAAEELTAEVFRIAWEQVLNGGEISSGWLFVTARNLLSNHHRATTRLTELHRQGHPTCSRSYGRSTRTSSRSTAPSPHATAWAMAGPTTPPSTDATG